MAQMPVSNKTSDTEKYRKEAIRKAFNDILLEELYNAKVPPIVLLKLDESTGTNYDFSKIGAIIGHNYKVVRKIKEGGYGQVYEVKSGTTGLAAAMKMELVIDPDRPNVEAFILDKFKRSTHCPKLYDSGTVDNFYYVVMQLLGPNCNDLRKQCVLSPKRFSVSTTHRLVTQFINATEELHILGFVNRDIKPSNFVVGLEDPRNVFMVDFGMARYFVTKSGTHKPFRRDVGFHGTVRYASLNAHNGEELSRRDDIWSIVYSYYEFLNGALPWDNESICETVALEKKRLNSTLENSMPREMNGVVKLVERLSFEQTPNYGAFKKMLTDVLISEKVQIDDLYDWQMAPNCQKQKHFEKKKSFLSRAIATLKKTFT